MVKSSICLFVNNIYYPSKHQQIFQSSELGNQVLDLKYLCLILDRHLTFEQHINSICQKVNIRTKILRQIRNFIPTSLATALYQSLIYPHFTYCYFIIDSVSENLKSKLQCYQNVALRAISKVDMSC